MNRKFGISLTLCLLIAHTQPPQAFEVTSVKPNLSGLDRSTGINIAGSHISGENLSLRTLILQAYDLLDFQIAGGPRWLASDRFDKFPAGSLPWVPDMKVESPALCRAGWHPAAGWQPASSWRMPVRRSTSSRNGKAECHSTAGCHPALQKALWPRVQVRSEACRFAVESL